MREVRWLFVALAMAVAPAAFADDSVRYSTGVMIRTDRTTHTGRVTASLGSSRIAGHVVVDPMGYLSEGVQSDTDALVELALPKRWHVAAGWRFSTEPVLGERYWRQAPVVAMSAPLPSLVWGHVNMRVGAEIAVTVVRHGDELPTIAIWDRGWDGAYDSIDFGLFMRAEIARPL